MVWIFLSVALACATVLYYQHSEHEFTTSNSTTPSSDITAQTFTQEQLDELYKKENIPSFDDVVKYINEEFSGVNYGE